MSQRGRLVVWILGAVILGSTAIFPCAVPAAEQSPAEDEKLRIIALGAHPDACEIFVGGTACLPTRC